MFAYGSSSGETRGRLADRLEALEGLVQEAFAPAGPTALEEFEDPNNLKALYEIFDDREPAYYEHQLAA